MNGRTGRLTVSAAVALAGTASAGPTFAPPTTLSTPEQPSGAAFGDLNNDGVLDLAVTVDAPDRIMILLGDGSGGLSPGQAIFTGGGTGADTIRVGDFDLDGDDDIAVVLNNTETLAVYTNLGGIFGLSGQAPLGEEPRRLQAGDIDGDGDLDFATANRDTNDISIVINDAGAFTTTALPVGSEPRGVAIGDLDGDGDGDLAVSLRDTRSLAVFTNTPSGFVAGQVLSVGGNVRPDSVQIADLDGDGFADVFAATSGTGLNQIQVFHGSGAGFSGATIVPIPGQNADTVRAADFDLDGDLDLAVTNDDSTMLVTVENQGSRVYTNPVTLTTGLNPQTIAIGDLDGNGSPDMAVPNRDSNTTSIFLSDAGGVEPCPADLTGPGGAPDGTLDANDFFAYLDLFASGDAAADLAGSAGVPDGVVDANDFFAYLTLFSAGCP